MKNLEDYEDKIAEVEAQTGCKVVNVELRDNTLHVQLEGSIREINIEGVITGEEES